MPGSGFSVFNLVPAGAGSARDIVFSADQSRAYVSLSTGQVQVYDLATHSLLTTWTFGTNLGAISLTEDGSSLLVVENNPATNGTATLYRVNTASGMATALNFAGFSAFRDVEVINGTTALVAGSGNFANLTLLNLTTNLFSSLAGNSSFGTVLTESGRYTLVADYGLSPGTFSVFDDVTGTIIASARSSLNTVSWGVQAISETSGLIAQFSYFNTIVITNIQLQPQTQFSVQGPVVGMTFSDDGQFFYYYDLNAGNIVKMETTGWTTVESISVGVANWHNNFNTGNELSVSSNGHYIVLRNSETGAVNLIDLTERNEIFAGTPGIDSFAGGPGDDVYYVNLAEDLITELQYEGMDIVNSTAASYTLSAFLERLNLEAGALNGTGNDQNNIIQGNEVANQLDGAGGNDNLLGLDGNDILIGGAGNDILDGGAGADAMDGGLGNDLFVVDDLGDTVTDAGGFDRVESSVTFVLNAGLEHLTLTGTSAVDGTGNSFDNLIIGNAAINDLTGGDGNDTLRGGGGNDILVGDAGSDILDGGTGADAMDGGMGDDLFLVDDAGDTAVDPGGFDRVESSATFVLSAGIENLALTGTAAIDGTGNALDNLIVGNSAANILSGGDGNDVLRGGGGNDRLSGGAGVDNMDGGNGDDIFVIDNVGDTLIDSSGTDLVEASISYSLGAGIENLTLTGSATIDGTGTTANNILTGNDGDNILSGLAGIDTLRGGDGNDRLDGGTGGDSMDGGLGDDVFIVDSSGDSIVDVGGIDRVESLTSYTLGVGIENLTLLGTAQLNGAGNADNNILVGNSASNRLDGAAGIDQLYGGLGNDIYVVDRQDDVVFENAAEGTDTVESSGNFYLYANIERLTLTGSANIFGVGNEQSNIVTGNAGENLLIAGAGADTVNGGGARDAIFGEAGNDILNGEAGIDYIVAGIGNDTLDGGADADEMYGQEGDDILRGGMSFDTDIMVGGNGQDTLFGNSGLGDYDLLYGNEGSDTYYVDTPDDLVFEQAGEGNDTVYADINGAGFYLYGNIENLVLLDDTPFGVGNDLANQMTGNAVGNYLLGGAGNDTLNGMGGNDVLFGEGGNDVFVVGQAMGNDVIGDFMQGQDRIDVSAYGLTFTELQSRFAQDGNVGAIQFANGDVIVLDNVNMSQLTAADFILTPVAEAPPKAEDLGSAFVGADTVLSFAESGLQRWQPVFDISYV